jgi:mannosyltransferase OCH1-like enzyme
MIPKVVHYCWFGESKKPKLVKDCMRSWKKHLPDYEIIEWNESNSDLSLPFVKEAYRLKKWAFVSDYIRLKVLYEYGGIYLDTDMLLLKSLDGLLSNKTFLGAECLEFINCAIVGTVRESVFIHNCLEQYKVIKISNEIDFGLITIPRIVTNIFKDAYDFNASFDTIVRKNEIVIYPAAYFYPLSYEHKDDILNFKQHVQKESYTIHLWSSSWIAYSEFYHFDRSQYIKGFQIVFDKVIKDKKIELQYIRKVALSVKRNLLNNK